MGQVANIHCRDPDPLRLDRCPDCGYLLTGLPEEGQCPECGFAYNADMIVLYGWGFGHSATMTNRKWTAGKFGCVLVPLSLLTAGAVWILVDTMRLAWSWGSRQALLLLLPLFLPCLIPAIQLITRFIAGLSCRRRQIREGLAPVQVRLFRQGFVQQDGLGPVRIKPWKRRRVQFDRLDSGENKCGYWCRVEAPKLWRLPLWGNPVDVKFRCDRKVGDQIRQRLNEWGLLDPPLCNEQERHPR